MILEMSGICRCGSGDHGARSRRRLDDHHRHRHRCDVDTTTADTTTADTTASSSRPVDATAGGAAAARRRRHHHPGPGRQDHRGVGRRPVRSAAAMAVATGGFGDHRGPGIGLDVVATTLGITADEVRTALQGRSDDRRAGREQGQDRPGRDRRDRRRGHGPDQRRGHRRQADPGAGRRAAWPSSPRGSPSSSTTPPPVAPVSVDEVSVAPVVDGDDDADATPTPTDTTVDTTGHHRHRR